MNPQLIDHSALFDAIPTALMILDKQLRFVAANNQYVSVTKSTRDKLIGRYVFDAFPEVSNRTKAVAEAFAHALAGHDNVLEAQPFAIRQPDGSLLEIWWHCTHTPIRDATGEIVGLLQQIRDITDKITAERMREIISQEYDHHLRNILTKVIAIARNTARGAPSLDSFLADYEARVGAMARTHHILVDSGWKALSLAELVSAELSPYAGDSATKIIIDGPPAMLGSRVAQALGMALHELTTNAARHGALSRPEGRLNINWEIDAASGALSFNWHESGLSRLERNNSAGFGSAVIDRVLPLETGGIVTRKLEPGGLVCHIQIPRPI